jgi:hypothetical protein
MMRDILKLLSELNIRCRILGLRLAWVLVMLCSSAAWCADSYNYQTGVLSIPSVMVNGTQYNNVQVTIAKVVSLGSGVGSTPNGTVDTYNSSNAQLQIPLVHVDTGESYVNAVIVVGSVLFVGPNNLVPVLVNGGYQNSLPNMLTTSVTVCVPNTNNCVAIDNIQVDTGSSGLRILASTLKGLSLPGQKGINANSSVYECAAFADGVIWGQVSSADITLGSEVAKSLPIQVITDTGGARIPKACSQQGFNESTLLTLGANGLMGVGLFLQDCGAYCTKSTAGMYFSCSTSSVCTPSTQPLALQVSNPVAFFPADNNGVVLQLPALSSGGTSSVSGNLIFGVGTQINNTPNASATMLPVPASGSLSGNFTSTYNGLSLPNSFIDSGSGSLFFNDNALTPCSMTGLAAGYFCPGTNTSVSNVAIAAAIPSAPNLNLSIGNAEYLFSENSGLDAVFNNLGSPAGTVLPNSFDFGMPFFFGRSVFTGLEQRNPQGQFFAFQAYP